MKLLRKGDREPRAVYSIGSAAAQQMILKAKDCSGPSEASEHTSINTALVLANLIEILREKKKLTDEDVLEILVDFEASPGE